MDLTDMVDNDSITANSSVPIDCALTPEGEPQIYSKKMDAYVPLNFGNPKGDIQKYNVGLGPGSWY